MQYLIDGHNLIGKLPDINLDDPNDEAKLVQKLIGFSARTKNRCTVVFDHGIPGGVSRMSNRNVKVIFSSTNSNADKVMIDRIYKQKNPKDWFVVSGDNEVLSVARRRRIQVLTSSQFVDLLQRPAPLDKPDVDEAVDVHLTEDEVDEWMTLFTKKPKKKK